MTQWRVKTSKVLNLKYVVHFTTWVIEDFKKNSLLVLRKENIHSVMSLCGCSHFPFISATYLREKQRVTIYLPHLAFKQLWDCRYHFPAMGPQLAICFLKISPGLDFQSGQIS